MTLTQDVVLRACAQVYPGARKLVETHGWSVPRVVSAAALHCFLEKMPESSATSIIRQAHKTYDEGRSIPKE